MKLSEAIDLVMPFVSTDETRLHLTRPARHPMHVVGTDGHTLACVRTDDPNENDLVRTWVGSDSNGMPVPRLELVVPAAPKRFGLWNPASTPTLAHYPAKWSTCVRFGGGRGTSPTVEAWLPARTSAHGKMLRPKITMIREQAIDGLDEIAKHVPKRIGVAGCYLLRAARFFVGPVYVYGNGPLDPLVFTAEALTPSKAAFLACPGFAIVMPMRI